MSCVTLSLHPCKCKKGPNLLFAISIPLSPNFRPSDIRATLLMQSKFIFWRSYSYLMSSNLSLVEYSRVKWQPCMRNFFNSIRNPTFSALPFFVWL